MPTLNIEQLRRPMTARQGTDLVLAMLQAFGFQTASWQDGRIQMGLVRTIGTIAADFSELGKLVVDFGFNRYAVGDALSEYSLSRFSSTRDAAVATEGPAQLFSTASVPYTILPGQLTATTPNGIEFQNTTGGTLNAGSVAVPSVLTLQWKARVAGASGNVQNATIHKLITPLAGVTVLNGLGSPWYSIAGRDEESDRALRLRNQTKWARLSVELIADAYKNIALNHGARKVRVDDTNPRGEGTLDVYCAGEAAVLGDAQLTALQEAFSVRALQTSPVYPQPAVSTSRLAVRSPVPSPLSLAVTVYHRPSFSGASIQAAVIAALEDLVVRTPIGGFSYAPGLTNVITIENVHEAIKRVDGVQTAEITSQATNFVIDPYALVTRGSWLITPQAVES